MGARSVYRALCWLTGWAATACATAGATALNVIPTADVIGSREAVLTHSVAGEQGRMRHTHAYSGQFGLGDRLEAGFDADYAGGTTLNAKVRLWESRNGRLAVAGGFTNFRKQSGDGYIVATGDQGAYRLHGGWMNDGQKRWFVGADTVVFGDVSLMAEHLGGRGGSTYVGFAAPIKGVRGASFGAFFGKPNTRHHPQEHGAFVSFGFRL